MTVRLHRSDLRRVVVAVDPAATDTETADDTGIIVVGRGPCQPSTCMLAQEGIRCPGHGYVLGDKTCHMKPIGWARQAVAAYDEWQADRIVAEVNNGGDMVGTVIHTVRAGIAYSKVTATRGKAVRAEPVAAMSEQGRIHFMGVFPELENELGTWTPDDDWSPNRLDAFVWGCTALGLVGGQGLAFMQFWADQKEKDELTVAKQHNGALAQLPRLNQDTEIKRVECKCPTGKKRFFDGLCVTCGGLPPEKPGR